MSGPARETARPDGAALALAAYESLAPAYDRFTEDYDYGRWLKGVEEWALANGLRGRRLLDVACGTGKSFEPMLARGYDVTACDISEAMVCEANRKSGGAARVIVADMRALPWRSEFDFVTCMDDAINYLLDERDLVRALKSMRRALRPGGILIFDTNSLATYRSTFAETFEVYSGDWRFTWRGEASPDFAPSNIAAAVLDIAGPEPPPPSRHVQRHWPVALLRSACKRAGLERISFRGQMTGGYLMGDPDERHHTKVVCVASRPIERAP